MPGKRRTVPRTREIALRARVETPPPRGDLMVSQETVVDWFGSPTSETIRNWVRRGMPREGTPARPRYFGPDVLQWHEFYSHLVARAKGGPVGHVSIAAAREWSLQSQFEADSTHWVLVPLAHDHPARERQLRVAAAGLTPATEEESA
jgi:hypothetical protein